MALIIETGSGVPGADSYASVSELKAYADARGESLPVDDQSIEVLLNQAMDCLQYSYEYRGARTFPDALLQWPRSGLKGIDENQIPPEVKFAQMKLACIAFTEDISSSTSTAQTTREKVDVIEIEYSDQGSSGMFVSPMVDNMLRRFVYDSSVGLLQQARVERA
ncbi:hypothetical protein LVQ77_17015 [Buttiauxella sp. S04-F03]|uniref:DnaT-like ssDNA-binding protein n=1 Tax=Buttiauxella sp. W03-F01 TaxID=2904524 RepID=UPI001E530A14|nr:DnaT-like ssDNA-binding protein [Buttiauxella sp. W03-F01]MCE0801987.1 hypothetical protein [Buttiauxella sp. W03-F01]